MIKIVNNIYNLINLKIKPLNKNKQTKKHDFTNDLAN